MPPSHGTALEPRASALVARRPYGKLGDLWWVPEVHGNDELLIGVSHRVPTSPRDRQPVIWRSFQQLGRPSQERKLNALSYLDVWRQAWGDVNVFRTLCLFATGNEEPILLGPFCLDIDSKPQPNGSYNWEDALAVTGEIVEIICSLGVPEKDLRIFHGGNWEFSVEVRPEAFRLTKYAASS